MVFQSMTCSTGSTHITQTPFHAEESQTPLFSMVMYNGFVHIKVNLLSICNSYTQF